MSLTGKVIEHEGSTYEVVLAYPATAEGRLLPVMAVRTEDGVMVTGLENLAAFMLDAGEAAAGRVVVVAKRETES